MSSDHIWIGMILMVWVVVTALIVTFDDGDSPNERILQLEKELLICREQSQWP